MVGSRPLPQADQPGLFLSASAVVLQGSQSFHPSASQPASLLASYFPSSFNHHPLILITQNELQLIRLEVILKGGGGEEKEERDGGWKEDEGGFVCLKMAR